jgi:arylsulfatase A-like enzyme
MISRREFLGAIPMLGVAAGRPNVLVFLTDQETAMIPGPVNIPNRRRLEAEGVRFTHAFCNTPQCSAARSALLTGLEPHQTGVLTNVDAGSLGKPLPPRLPTLGSVFRSAGYRTGYFGKWHLGDQTKGLDAFGFSIARQGSDSQVAEEAAAWIAQQTGPWLAYVSVLNPHQIYSIGNVLKTTRPRPGVAAPSTDLGNLAFKPSEQQEYVDKDQGKQTRNFTPEDWIRYRTFYCELVERADACLGTVLGAIGDPRSAIIAYSSDHGDAIGEHGLPFKGPFMYEPEIRIPLVISAAGRLKSQVRDDLVTQTDVAPTLASLAGLRWPSKISGRDLFHQRDTGDAVFLEYYAKQKWVNPIRTIRTTRWKLNWYDSGHQELYDLSSDPQETRNLAAEAQFSRVKGELEGRLNAWRGPITNAARV